MIIRSKKTRYENQVSSIHIPILVDLLANTLKYYLQVLLNKILHAITASVPTTCS